jgi:hypothetical protein
MRSSMISCMHSGLIDLTAAFTTEAGQAAAAELLKDEKRFIDLPNSPIWLGEENVVFGPPNQTRRPDKGCTYPRHWGIRTPPMCHRWGSAGSATYGQKVTAVADPIAPVVAWPQAAFVAPYAQARGFERGLKPVSLG